jgi:hypothetical protein
LETGGGLGGFGAAVWLCSNLGGRAAASKELQGRGALGRRQAPISLAVGALALVVCLQGLVSLPSVPYNVRELFDQGPRVLIAVLLTAALYWCFGQPALLAVWLNGGTWKRCLALPLLVALGGATTFALLRVAVPLESIHDIVGAPLLGWPWEWELLGRFMALFAGPNLLFALGAALAATAAPRVGARRREVWWRWSASVALLLPLVHWVVVAHASTDNLTELMSHGGTWGTSALLGLWLLSIAVPGALLSSCVAGGCGGWGAVFSVVAASVPLGYALLWLATEQAIEKYGHVFSALQFLLSPDRDHLATGSALASRYIVAHVALIFLVAVTQHPVWLLKAGRDRSEESGDQPVPPVVEAEGPSIP